MKGYGCIEIQDTTILSHKLINITLRKSILKKNLTSVCWGHTHFLFLSQFCPSITHTKAYQSPRIITLFISNRSTDA